MNDRFRQLAEQAGTWEYFNAEDEKTKAMDEQALQNFAESLIREAAQFVSGSSEVYTQAEQDACVRAAIGLKKYFEIEE